MGSYLSEPVTEKVSSDDNGDKLNCGASSMQGWRVTQEDAHNCILDFDEDTSLFAVYDGHGGHEVAQFTSQQFPDFLKKVAAYKNGNMKDALIEAFLGFDQTLVTPEVVEQLEELAADKESDEEEDLCNLKEEAAMPIGLVIDKYMSNCKNKVVCAKEKKSDDEKPGSSSAHNECSSSSSSSSSSSGNSGCSTSSSSHSTIDKVTNISDNVSSSSSDNAEGITSNTTDTAESSSIKNGTANSTAKLEAPDSTGDVTAEVCTPSKTMPDVNHGEQNGDATPAEIKDNDNISTTQENGEVAVKKKGKATTKTKGVTPSKEANLRRSARQLYSSICNFSGASEEDDEEEEDEEDKTFVAPNDDSSDEQEENEAEAEESDKTSDEDGDDEDDDDDEEGEDEDEDFNSLEFVRNMKEGPGSDSGCTAVVALLKGNELYVANAGDSRCVVCRNGKAVEMSIDHKPEDEPERDRVVKAGGVVTNDGRVNGGLNLSRAFGDHGYKQNKALSDREQMITALPDVRTLTIDPIDDEFMVLACDGIWNFMSSQEVVDFVRPRIQKGCDQLSQICEEMFDHCLAPNTIGDGTGCDNMTAIVVQFKSGTLKRSASQSSDKLNESAKRAKTEEVLDEKQQEVESTV